MTDPSYTVRESARLLGIEERIVVDLVASRAFRTYKHRTWPEPRISIFTLEQYARAHRLALRHPDPGAPGFVYFVQAESGGPIKIGYATDPLARLAGLQTGNPEPLVILALDRYGIEADYHEQFAHLRLRGEWFIPADDLIATIAGVKSNNRRETAWLSQ